MKSVLKLQGMESGAMTARAVNELSSLISNNCCNQV